MMTSGIGGRTAGAKNLPHQEPTSVHENRGNFVDLALRCIFLPVVGPEVYVLGSSGFQL